MAETKRIEKSRILDRFAPDGKPWREDVLHALGASLVRWLKGDTGPEVEPAIDVSGYAEMAKQLTPRPNWIALRNARLSDCDWTQLPDADLTKDQVAAWKAYRRALRDLLVTAGELDAPAWPTPPEK